MDCRWARHDAPDCGGCAIRRFTACQAVDAAETQDLGLAHRLVPAAGDLFTPGAPSHEVLVVLRGWACLYEGLEDGRRQILRFLLPGDMSGLHGQETWHGFGAQALTDLLVCAIPRAGYLRLARRCPDLAVEASRIAAVQEAEAMQRLTSVGRRRARERLALLLLDLHGRARDRGSRGPAADVVLPLTQVDLADALGLTPVHINRTLRELRDGGMIVLGNRAVCVRDANLLAAAAGRHGLDGSEGARAAGPRQ